MIMLLDAAREGIFWGLTYFMLTYVASYMARWFKDQDPWD